MWELEMRRSFVERPEETRNYSSVHAGVVLRFTLCGVGHVKIALHWTISWDHFGWELLLEKQKKARML